MQTLRQKARPYLGSRAFYAGALGVMAPVTVQQLINNLFNMIDNLMVGSLDPSGLAMSAVTVANRPYTIFFGVFFGMTGAAGLLISQYYGARDYKTCRALFALQVVIGLAASLCVALSDLTLLGTISPARILLYALVLAAAYLGGSPAGTAAAGGTKSGVAAT